MVGAAKVEIKNRETQRFNVIITSSSGVEVVRYSTHIYSEGTSLFKVNDIKQYN